ncbi:hypothetical protein T01_13283 [Trichinella spiralis]|uniref:Uncharacterized protein n=1 Tax=Trichinella spiralis TaxID=6334 RepID=A0A0V1BYL0_TRISP|nr:hypothetical protein T01_13283 [Trichinella spiralis]
MEVHQLKTGEEYGFAVISFIYIKYPNNIDAHMLTQNAYEHYLLDIFLIQDEILITLSVKFTGLFIISYMNGWSKITVYYYQKSVMIVLLSCNFSCMNNLRYCPSYTAAVRILSFIIHFVRL